MNQLASTGSLITSNVVPRVETYYLVTQDTLSSIKEKTILCDLFMLIGSLLLGGFLSAFLALATSAGLSTEAVAALEAYQYVFLLIGLTLIVVAAVYYFMGNALIDKIKTSELAVTSVPVQADNIPSS